MAPQLLHSLTLAEPVSQRCDDLIMSTLCGTIVELPFILSSINIKAKCLCLDGGRITLAWKLCHSGFVLRHGRCIHPVERPFWIGFYSISWGWVGFRIGLSKFLLFFPWLFCTFLCTLVWMVLFIFYSPSVMFRYHDVISLSASTFTCGALLVVLLAVRISVLSVKLKLGLVFGDWHRVDVQFLFVSSCH